MTKYYCIVFLDKLNPENPHYQHGTICSNSTRELCIYTDKAEAERMYLDRWHGDGYWKDCYELWEFDVP